MRLLSLTLVAFIILYMLLMLIPHSSFAQTRTCDDDCAQVDSASYLPDFYSQSGSSNVSGLFVVNGEYFAASRFEVTQTISSRLNFSERISACAAHTRPGGVGRDRSVFYFSNFSYKMIGVNAFRCIGTMFVIPPDTVAVPLPDDYLAVCTSAENTSGSAGMGTVCTVIESIDDDNVPTYSSASIGSSMSCGICSDCNPPNITISGILYGNTCDRPSAVQCGSGTYITALDFCSDACSSFSGCFDEVSASCEVGETFSNYVYDSPGNYSWSCTGADNPENYAQGDILVNSVDKRDSDHDGTLNDVDVDDDNDGVLDVTDSSPTGPGSSSSTINVSRDGTLSAVATNMGVGNYVADRATVGDCDPTASDYAACVGFSNAGLFDSATEDLLVDFLESSTVVPDIPVTALADTGLIEEISLLNVFSNITGTGFISSSFPNACPQLPDFVVFGQSISFDNFESIWCTFLNYLGNLVTLLGSLLVGLIFIKQFYGRGIF